MIRYYKLFDLLNRREMNLSDLRQIISSATVAKLRKGEYISGEVIEKICLFLECQPGDIMEVVEVIQNSDNFSIITKKEVPEDIPHAISIEHTIFETYECDDKLASDENNLTKRCKIETETL